MIQDFDSSPGVNKSFAVLPHQPPPPVRVVLQRAHGELKRGRIAGPAILHSEDVPG